MNIFNIDGFMPHGHCYLWRTDILLSNVISDIFIALSYLIIPIVIAIILHKRKDLPFKPTIRVFVVFIFFCAITHFMQIVNVWYPYYALTGVIKVITAIVSVVSTVIILKGLSQILGLPSLENLQHRLFSDLHQTIESLPVGIMFCDKKGMIIDQNKFAHQLFGYSLEELKGQLIGNVLQFSLDSENGHGVSFINDQGDVEENTFNLKAKTKSGDVKYLEVNAKVMTLQAGNNEICCFTIKDNTENHVRNTQIKETYDVLNVATYGMPSVLCYFSKSGVFEYANFAYFKKWQLEHDQVIGKNYFDTLSASQAEFIRPYFERALSGKEVRFNHAVTLPNGLNREFDTYFIPKFALDGSIEGVVKLAHDITILNSTLAKLEKTNRQLEEYAFLVSHDLRAPIRHITNYLELYEEESTSEAPNEERLKKYIAVVKGSSIKVQNMISGMLKIVSISDVVVKKEKLPVKNLVDYFSEFFAAKITINAQYSDGLDLIVDKELIDSVFLNLIKNTIKHSGLDKPEVKLVFKKDGKNITLDYFDNGKGISVDIAKNIFKPFVKNSDSSGSGLGMAIVFRCLERLDATIDCIPSEKGANFHIKFTD